MLAGHWQDFKIENLNATKADSLLLQWQKLARHAAAPAGFNAPELALPILKHLGKAELATVTHGPDLLFALPFAKKRGFNASWETPLTASGAPHLADDLKDATLTAFLNAQSKPFLFSAIPADGAFHAAIKKQSKHYAVLESWARAGLIIEGSYENWLQTNFDQKRRKEFKRLRNRLSEQGELYTQTLSAKSDLSTFVADFLMLEASGWKGKKGTAIDATPKLATALHDAAQGLHQSGKLRFWSLKLNGKAIASLFAIVENGHAWLGKIAYDENFAKYSPGALIIFDCTETFFAEAGITQVDSSAIPDHPLIDRIWRDRLPMISVFVGPAKLSKLQFNFIVTVARQKLKWRSTLRDLYYKAKGKKRS
jgi:CelD/BcsL family acetyltransferase involved in cellulose biosynthesis